jgi:hypothetical protein
MEPNVRYRIHKIPSVDDIRYQSSQHPHILTHSEPFYYYFPL